MKIGGVYDYKGKPVYVVSGQYESNGRISNFWNFKYVNDNGLLGKAGGDYGPLGPELQAEMRIFVKGETTAEHEASVPKTIISDGDKWRRVGELYPLAHPALTRSEFDEWYKVHNGKFKDAEGFWESFWFTFKGKVIA